MYMTKSVSHTSHESISYKHISNTAKIAKDGKVAQQDTYIAVLLLQISQEKAFDITQLLKSLSDLSFNDWQCSK